MVGFACIPAYVRLFELYTSYLLNDAFATKASANPIYMYPQRFSLFPILLSAMMALFIVGCDKTSSQTHDNHAPNHAEHDACDDNHDGHHNAAPDTEGHSDEIILTEAQAKAAGLRTEVVRPSSFHQVIRVSGSILSAPADEQTIVATAAGIVHFTAAAQTDGASLNAGQAVVTISAQRLAEGDPARKAKVAYDIATRELQRAERLAADQIIPTKELEQMRARYETAKIAYEAQANQMTASGVSVSTPISGYLKTRLLRNGDYAEVGTPLAVITRTRRLQLRADVPEAHFAALRKVSTANFRPAHSQHTFQLSELNGRLLGYGRATEGGGYLPITFEFDNVGDFVPGSFVEVFLLSRPHPNVIAVPTDAIIESEGLHFVFVTAHDEPYSFERRQVRIGATDGRRIEILEGLKAGETVVVAGAVRVKLASSSSAIPDGHSH